MSKNSFTLATPRYRVVGTSGNNFDVFNQKKNAIKAAIALATEYAGNTFEVLKEVNGKKKIVFSLKIDTQFDFDDLKEVYQGLVTAYQNKLDKTRYWRKDE